MENNTVTVPTREYEEFIRDSEKIRILTQAAMDEVDPGDYWLRVICGVQKQEVSETILEKLPEQELMRSPFEPAINIEKIEDAPESDTEPEPVNPPSTDEEED